VHADLANRAGCPEVSWELFRQALLSDYTDTQEGTTKEGIHTGVMAGTVLLALSAYAGLDVSGPDVSVTPCLPARWRSMRFNVGFRGVRYSFEVDREKVMVRVDRPATVAVGGAAHSLAADVWTTLDVE
jgi:trehalose/maltose hydrolase-like predicted phosphorylase